ncbi:MAG: host attachment protein [Kofleriaceae bacterium]
MYRACIVTADTQHSHLYLYDRSDETTGIAEHFVEVAKLASTHVEHAGGHVDKLITEFADHVATRIGEIATAHSLATVIVCAGPRMLGQLRTAMHHLQPGTTVTEVAHELTKLSPHDLRARLGEDGVLPPQR